MAGQIRVAYVSGLLGALSAFGGAFPHLLQGVGLRPDDFADPDRFTAPGADGPALLIAAVRLPGVRLIDNVALPAKI